MTILMELVVQTTFSYFGTIAFAIMINIPRRALNACGLCGMAGWLTFWLLYQVGSGRMVANVMGSLILGVMGLYFARKKKMPAILFNIPGIVPLVPGATAYQAVYEMVLGSVNKAIIYSVRVLLVAGGIAVGFMLTSLLSEIMTKIRQHRMTIK
ncbi:MAG TPA: threonine/serine exporter family protein [Lapidilactobacillus dextrinicus]|uniref:Threonine/serine exporter family protein n=1 Tax=Lapidilactobacillus dextrinicus TaxID=51664 RepID=A0A921B500_9LACO|nr:threonine/serine exporter family protein [Lapidilactobacillus dextrinicus]